MPLMTFPLVEVQHTFYEPPSDELLRKWRWTVPQGFEFTMKAWQLVTHEGSSPTYKRIRRPLTETQIEEDGFFKPTDTVQGALQLINALAEWLIALTGMHGVAMSPKAGAHGELGAVGEAGMRDLIHSCQALFLESNVSNRQHLVENPVEQLGPAGEAGQRASAG